MAVELARKQIRPKPWGVAQLRPWCRVIPDAPIGEIWFDRPNGAAATAPSLLLKLLFARQPLSIQVHPDDAYARSIGQARGKTEAWYVLHADPSGKVALGLDRTLTAPQLRQAVADGSISDRVVWQPVTAGDTLLVPAGTIHVIGAGVVMAEIQQRSDTTFRLYDHGRQRELHIDDGVAVAQGGPAAPQARTNRLTDERTELVSCPHFVFERIMLEPDTTWRLQAARETWLLVIGGDARAARFDIATGDAVFVEADDVEINTGEIGMVALVAYAAAKPAPNLLRHCAAPARLNASAYGVSQLPSSFPRPSRVGTHQHIGTSE